MCILAGLWSDINTPVIHMARSDSRDIPRACTWADGAQCKAHVGGQHLSFLACLGQVVATWPFWHLCIPRLVPAWWPMTGVWIGLSPWSHTKWDAHSSIHMPMSLSYHAMPHVNTIPSLRQISLHFVLLGVGIWCSLAQEIRMLTPTLGTHCNLCRLSEVLVETTNVY
jgi:hypothetical protein